MEVATPHRPPCEVHINARPFYNLTGEGKILSSTTFLTAQKRGVACPAQPCLSILLLWGMLLFVLGFGNPEAPHSWEPGHCSVSGAGSEREGGHLSSTPCSRLGGGRCPIHAVPALAHTCRKHANDVADVAGRP